MTRMQDDSARTVNAAAVVLAAAARSSTGLNHHQQQQQQLDDDHHTVTKRRWWSRLTANLCFRPHGHPRRIADAGPTSPEPAGATDHTAAYIHHAPQPVLAFVAPPSSPASPLLASEAPSPVLLLNASTYSSPTAGPPSIFAIGPYAHEPQQLVSPPVPSTFTTEPSTAPLTPPPECAYLHLATNPSSPEVPFARFLASSSDAAEQHCGVEGFHAYQLHPGSPIGGPLVSPGSVCSTSSPPPLFRVTEQPPMILEPEDIASRKLHRLRARNEGSLLDGHIPAAAPAPSGWQSSRAVPFEASTGSEEGGGSARLCADETYHDLPKSGEFVFGSADGGAAPVAAASVPSDWFAGEASDGRASADAEGRKKWPFFPMVEHGTIE